jgi:DNA-binding MarR family transcriptional regulator
MDETGSLAQAKAIDSLLLGLGRHLFSTDDQPAAELPVGQLRVCGILYGGPRPMSALSRELGVSLSAMTQIADRLARARLVSRVPKGTDRRVRCLQLTPRGAKLMRDREDSRVRRVSAALEHLSPEQRKELLAALDTFTDACAAASGQRRVRCRHVWRGERVRG